MTRERSRRGPAGRERTAADDAVSGGDARRERAAASPAAPLGRREFLAGSASLAVAASVGLACSGKDNPPPADAGRDRAVTEGGRPDGPRGEVRAADGPARCTSSPPPLVPSATPGRVVEVLDAKAVVGGVVNGPRVKAMLGAALLGLTKQTDLQAAWKALLPDFTSTMRIGIKVNCLNSYLYNSVELLQALVATLIADLGADAQKIIVWDRRDDELARSKITTAAVGAKVLGTVKSPSDAGGPGYESKAECVIDQETHLSRILTEQTDVTINIPLLKTHDISAMTGALKNAYGCIDNPGSFHTALNRYLPAIYRLDRVRQRMRLHITEGLLAVIKGDTSDPPDTVANRLLVATDPLALDSHALALVNKLRGVLPNLPAAKLAWLDEAAKLNLGTRTVDAQLVTIP